MTQLTVSGDGQRAYLVTADGVVVMCTRTRQVIETVGVAGSPSCAVESRDGQRLYIADYDGVVTAVSVASPAAALPEQLLLDDAVARMLELEPAV